MHVKGASVEAVGWVNSSDADESSHWELAIVFEIGKGRIAQWAVSLFRCAKL